MTCPRCNGVGVIRDTESSALHILRILQEEAMKEGTAAVHAQVPVEVASFLLNEKRADIAKLEARLRVSVVLIPNKFLDTPHYHIERLKHDDARLEVAKASFERAAELAPSLDTPYVGGKPVDERARARQEAVVKGIVPETPAPVVPTPAAASLPPRVDAPKAGLWDRIVAFFTGSDAEPAPIVVPLASVRSKPAAGEPGRGERRRGRGEHEGRREGRRDGRRDASRHERRDTKGAGERRAEPEKRRDERRSAAQSDGKPRPEAVPQELRGEDGKRKPRQRPQKDRPVVAEPAERVTLPEDIGPSPSVSAIGSLVTADTVAAEAPAGDASDEQRGRRRRRRRGRGGRGAGSAAAPRGNGSAELHPDGMDELVHDEAPELQRVAPTSLPTQGETSPDTINVSNITAVRVPPLVTAPTIIALPVVHPAPLPIDELQPVLRDAGLMMVQTVAEKHAEVQARMAMEPRAERVPRERGSLPPLDEVPLVQVETRRQ